MDEWETGTVIQRDFTAAVYEPIYAEHLTTIQAIDAADPDALDEVAKAIFEDCMYVPLSPEHSESLVRSVLTTCLCLAGISTRLLLLDLQ